jgi:hypothetical protein
MLVAACNGNTSRHLGACRYSRLRRNTQLLLLLLRLLLQEYTLRLPLPSRSAALLIITVQQDHLPLPCCIRLASSIKARCKPAPNRILTLLCQSTLLLGSTSATRSSSSSGRRLLLQER